jgi:hypothetical protein
MDLSLRPARTRRGLVALAAVVLALLVRAVITRSADRGHPVPAPATLPASEPAGPLYEYAAGSEGPLTSP